MEIVKGNQLPEGVKQVNVETRGRIYPVTPDGSQWEIRFHFLGDMGNGSEVLGECVLRSFNGGAIGLPGMAGELPAAAAKLVETAIAALTASREQAAEEQGRITLASSMPTERRN